MRIERIMTVPRILSPGAAPGWKNLVTDSTPNFGKRKIKPFFGRDKGSSIEIK